MDEKQCSIEHHAVLYALLARNALAIGDDGKRALKNATIAYGNERGRRMANYAQKEGIIPCGETYPIFKEWRAPGEEGNIPGESGNLPSYTTRVIRCQWTESWKKHGLLEYGRYYCHDIDKSMYQSYQQFHKLTIHGLLSAGDEMCIFDWGYPRTLDMAAQIAEKQGEIGERYVRNFNFHTADLLRTVASVLQEECKERGEHACQRAWEEFQEIFGTEYSKVVEQSARKENWNIFLFSKKQNQK